MHPGNASSNLVGFHHSGHLLLPVRGVAHLERSMSKRLWGWVNADSAARNLSVSFNAATTRTTFAESESWLTLPHKLPVTFCLCLSCVAQSVRAER